MWDDGQFWDAARQRRLALRSCARCANICHPPLPMCPRCQSTEWRMTDCSGRAKVKDWLMSTHPSRPDEPPRLVAVVELEEGARLVTNLVDVQLQDVHEDMAVALCFAPDGDLMLPRFRPLD